MERVPAIREPAGGRASEPCPPAPLPALPAAQVLALQRTAGNQRVAQLLQRPSRPALSRALDTEFEHGGEPTPEEQKVCDEFGATVSKLVDQAHLDLLAGKVTDWKGAKIAAFLKLLMKQHKTAIVHAGSVIEERVYALMKEAKLPAKWTPQFTAGMGGVSRPDIVVNLSDDREALIDITSQRGHILGKGGAWTTSKRYVYVAEAWFPSIFAEHLPHIRKAVQAGGLGEEELAAMQAEVADLRKNQAEARKKELAQALELYNQYDSFAAFVREAFDEDKGAAVAWMREHGLGTRKGVPRKKGRRKRSEVTKKAAKRKAIKRNQELTPAVVHERSKARAEDYRRKKKEEAQAAKRAKALAGKGKKDEDEEPEAEVGEPEEELEPVVDDSGGMDVDEDGPEDEAEEEADDDEPAAEVEMEAVEV